MSGSSRPKRPPGDYKSDATHLTALVASPLHDKVRRLPGGHSAPNVRYMPISVLMTIIGSLGLIVTGVGFYVGTGTSSVTALIPAFLGAPLLACGVSAAKAAASKVAIHIASVLALLGAVGSTRVFMKWSDLSTAALSAQLIMFLICAGLVVVYIGSFLKARRTAQP